MPGYVSLILEAHIVGEEKDSHKLLSDFHICTMAHIAYIHAHSI